LRGKFGLSGGVRPVQSRPQIEQSPVSARSSIAARLPAGTIPAAAALGLSAILLLMSP
jgi:hypothetical protein